MLATLGKLIVGNENETLNNIYKTFFESGKAGEIKAALEEVDALKDEGKLHSA